MIKIGKCVTCGAVTTSTKRVKIYCGHQKELNSCAFNQMRFRQRQVTKDAKDKRPPKIIVAKKKRHPSQYEWDLIKKNARFLNL